jgi:DedD protein
MNPLLESELDHRGHNLPNEREISLGPGTILGIFFALAVVCACFFGFGYSLGRRSAQLATPPPAVRSPATSASAAKPAAGSVGVPLPSVEPNITPAAPAPSSHGVLPSDAIIAGDKPAAPASSAASPVAAGSFIVQVAAVSTQQIADIEVAALRKDGYDVVVRHEPQDTLFHVQIGPFADKKDAEAMRQRILADGFNAIVK